MSIIIGSIFFSLYYCRYRDISFERTEDIKPTFDNCEKVLLDAKLIGYAFGKQKVLFLDLKYDISICLYLIWPYAENKIKTMQKAIYPPPPIKPTKTNN